MRNNLVNSTDNQNWQDFDANFYRNQYTDLRKMSDSQALEHFKLFGVREGRVGSPLALRENFIKLAEQQQSVLEIGPFFNPVLSGSNVSYFDIMNQQGLIDRAKSIGQSFKKVPKISFISLTGDLSVVDKKFDAVISSHCIEHQPDLINHLNQVSNILNDGCIYYLIIPDKRYCFDHFIPPTHIANVIQASVDCRRTHTLASVIEHRALTTHNDCIRHWNGDHFDSNYFSTIVSRAKSAVREHLDAQGAYVDVHAWQFTPAEFRQLMTMLFDGGYTKMKPMRVFETPHGRNEFTAIFSKNA